MIHTKGLIHVPLMEPPFLLQCKVTLTWKGIQSNRIKTLSKKLNVSVSVSIKWLFYLKHQGSEWLSFPSFVP